MRLKPVATFLLGLGTLLLSVTTGHPCGGYGVAEPVKLPGTIGVAVTRAGQLYAVTTNSHLIALDLKQSKVRDFGTFDMKLAPFVDVLGDQACIASQNRVYLVNLKTGKIVHAAVCEHDVRGVGFLCDQRAYIQNGAALDVLNFTTGKTTRLAEQLGTTVARRTAAIACDVGAGPVGSDVAGKCLFAALACGKGCLAAIDPESGKKIDQILTPELRLDSGMHAVRNLHIVGDKAFVLCVRFSYGVWIDSFGTIDLKSRKYTSLKLPSTMEHEPSLVVGTGGTVFLTGGEGTFEYDADGKLIGPVLGKNSGRVVAVWNRRALVAGQDSLQMVTLARPAANYVR